MRIAAVVINYNTFEHTSRSVASLEADPGVASIVVVDNGSSESDVSRLEGLVAQSRLTVLSAQQTNLGFAEGCNVGIREALSDPAIEMVLLLNSDAWLQVGALGAMLDEAGASSPPHLVGGIVRKPDGTVDSLGIALYWSCLASNRMTTRDVFFGPTGGCALYSREVLETLQQKHGYMFDPEFFCYAEDTDVSARAILLGYKPIYVDRLVATHVGQLSSGGGFNDFVLYHGIRNSIWTLVKCVPWPVIACAGPLILVMHLAIILRHTLKGQGRVVFRLYRDAIKGLPGMLRKRRRVQSLRRIGARQFMAFMTPKFYDFGYLTRGLRELFN